MKKFTKIIITFLLIFFIGILIAYKNMFTTYNKVNVEQTVVEVSDFSAIKKGKVIKIL
jgi:hypothetical protein